MITDKLAENFVAKKKFFIYVFTAITLMFAGFSFVTYSLSKVNFYENVDRLLKNSAYSINFLLEKDFHDRAISKSSIGELEDKINIDRLTDYANFSEIEYLYTMIKKDGKVYFTSSSATEDDFEKELVTRYFDEYESATKELLEAFDSNKIVFEESSDKWGTFRSVFIPLTSQNGQKYILGADIKVDYIHNNLDSILVNYIILFSLSLMIIYYIYSKKNRIETLELEGIKAVNESLEDEIKVKTQELEELNKSLETKVKKEVKKNIEQEKLLLKSSKYVAMGEMIDAVAHQWKQPLNLINIELGSIIELYKLNMASQKDIEDSVNLSLNQIEHLNTTINRFKNFFRPDQKKDFVNLEESIKKSLDLLNSILKSKNVSIVINSNEEIKCELIESEFTHVIINLINNSIDAFDENKIENRNIDINLSQVENKILIEYQDNAGGIPENAIENIFKANFTTKSEDKGTGIGLYLSMMIVQKVDGDIKVRNNKGSHGMGALFTITL